MFFKKLLKIILILFSALILYISLSFLSLLFPTKTQGGEQTKDIYLYQDKMHTEIIIKISDFKKDFLKFFPNLLRNQSNGYLSFSYGDEEFMMKVTSWDKIELKITLTSLFLNTPALIRVGYYQNINKENLINVKLSEQSLIKLKKSILDGFLVENKKLIRYKDAYQNYDTFYFKAKKSYNLFHTCNNWSSKRLIDAGIKSSYLTPFAGQVVYHLK